jgi:hypothetical protein
MRGCPLARPGSAWSVKGIDADARAIARSRAGAADLTIGAWIDKAILAHAHGSASDGSPMAPTNLNQTPSTPDNVAPDRHLADRLRDDDLLALIEAELEASRDRLDQSLRPVGYALKDLALRLVAAESLNRGGTNSSTKSTPSLTNQIPGPSDSAPISAFALADRPPPPLGSLAPIITDAEIPTPVNRNCVPPQPKGDLASPINDIDPPPSWIGSPRESQAYPVGSGDADHPDHPRATAVPPSGALHFIDPAEMPAPPSRDRLETPSFSPGSAILKAPDLDDSADALETPTSQSDRDGVRFTGVQLGFKSDPDRASNEARETTGRRAIRGLRIAAGLAPILIIASLVGGYFLAEPLGITALRDTTKNTIAHHAEAVTATVRNAYRAAAAHLEDLGESEELVTARAPREDGNPPLASSESISRPKDTGLKPSTQAGHDGATAPMTDTITKEPRGDTKSERSKIPSTASDDPPIANLSPRESLKTKQRPVKPNTLKKSEKSDAASSATSILPPKKRPPVRQPKPQTNLAALPKAPAIGTGEIPSSRLDGKALLASLKSEARAGDPRAQHELARRLIQGDGVAQDFSAGSEWFREAAIQGVANAQYNLAVLYERGLGVTKDDVRALLWYHSAAEQSHPQAQYNLGIFYLQGRGIPLSYAEAVRWFTSASNQGVARATYNLAVLTEDGLGVPPDKKKAMILYEKASVAGHHEAASRLALLRDPNARDTKPATFEDTADTQAEGGSTGTTVADIQAYLRNSGIYEGRIDGIAGPKTRTAIRKYQKLHALPITGIPSEILLDFMNTSRGSEPPVGSATG